MELSTDDLTITYKETFTARSSWYNLGLALELPVATLDDIDIDNRYNRDPKDQLREVLKVWLRRAHKPTWQSLVDAMDNPIVDEPRLARTLEEKYCAALHPEPTSSMELLQEQVVADTEATAALKETYLQQERTLEDLQGTVAARSFQIQEFEEQVSKKTKLEDTVTAQGLQIHEMVRKVREKKAQQQEEVTYDPSSATEEGQMPRWMVEESVPAVMPRGQTVVEKKIQQQEEVTSDPSSATVAEGGLRLRWTVKESMPVMIQRGQAVVDGCMVYFLSFSQRVIHSYNSEWRTWSTLPICPKWECSLAIVNGLLTTIGGKIVCQSEYTFTNTLLSLIVKEKGKDREWCEQFHPMPTKRAGTAAVCTGKALVVAGGCNASGMLSTIEVMGTYTLQWSIATSLPCPRQEASATVCGDYVYLTGGLIGTMLTCDLSKLLKSCQPQSLVAWIKSAFTTREEIWQEVANLPVSSTTCVAFNGHLLAVGGDVCYRLTTNNIYTLNPTTNSWEVISHMPTARSNCLVAVLPGNKLMVVGSYIYQTLQSKIEQDSLEYVHCNLATHQKLCPSIKVTA